MAVNEYDVAVIGGGIIGLSVAYALSSPGDLSVAVVEKEQSLAVHQSGRNSGVIHSGLYYRPGSLKAELCVTGADRMVEFCEEHRIPWSRNGKVVVATDDSQLGRLDRLYERGAANGVQGVRRIGPNELEELEPHVRGAGAVHVPTAGTVDYRQVCLVLAEQLTRADVTIRASFPVEAFALSLSGVTLSGKAGTVRAKFTVNCAGLFADRLAAMAGVDSPVRIIPFRGEYYDVTGLSAQLLRTSVYPVPEPTLPFLGVHLTKSQTGKVHAGPNAVLALAREGYSWSAIRPRELAWTLRYGGFWRLAGRHWRAGLNEAVRSFSTRRFAASVRSLIPDVSSRDLRRAESGVRAQAVTPEGELHDDFVIVPGPSSLHVLNAPSPGATSSLSIGAHIARLVRAAIGA